jgi:hypothetical protein
VVAQHWQHGGSGGSSGSMAVAASFAVEAVALGCAILVVAAVRLEVWRHCGGGGSDY